VPDKAMTQAELDRQALADLARKIDTGQATSAERVEFRRRLEAAPNLWRIVGDLNLQAEHHLIVNLPEAMQDGLRVGRRAVQADLGYATAPPIERLLIEAVGLAWLRLGIMELRHASSAWAGPGNAQADFWSRNLTAAQGRYLRAVVALARVRRLLGPTALQANIGQQVTAAQVVAGKDKGRNRGGRREESPRRSKDRYA